MIIYGHRGAAGEAPENTIAGCRHAIERGVRHIEIDLQLSSDGEIVIIHDTTTTRTTGVKGRVNQQSAAALNKLDARAFGPQWPNKRGTEVPTLRKLLKACPELVGVELEIKSVRRSDNEAILTQLAEIFPNGRAAKGMVITCSDPAVLNSALEIAPWIERGFVSTVDDPGPVITANKCAMLATHWSLCTPELVRNMRKQKVDVSVWTVNSADTVKALYKMGVHSVITDYPSMAVPLLTALSR